MLQTYSDFLAHVKACGFLAFSGRYPAGISTLEALTDPIQWHTGDTETDPWQWKDRAAQEKKLAFGSILGGRKGFISSALYPLFYSACRPDGDIDERFKGSYVKHTVFDVYKLFSAGTMLDTAEIRKALGVTKKEGAAAVDAAIVTLQREFYITVSGNRRKISLDGLEYGWPANVYSLVDDWASDWLHEALLPTDEARARILDHCIQLDSGANIKAITKLLF